MVRIMAKILSSIRLLLVSGLILATSCGFIFSQPASALEPKGWSFLYGVGNNLTPNGTIRIGYNQWEFGKLNHWAYGAAKNFYFAPSYYTSLGFAFMPSQSGTTVGVVAGVGANWELYWGMSLRLEIAANANINANVYQQGILGIGYDF
jgi:hypothetical protein